MPSSVLYALSVCHMPRSRLLVSSVAQPCVRGMKFVSHDPGLTVTMLDATRPSSHFIRL